MTSAKTHRPTVGRLIVLEGVDGSGKTTLAQELVAHLVAQNEHAVYFSFPGREPGTLGAQIYELHHRAKELGVNAKVHPASLQMLHIAAHIDAIENRIFPTLRAGTHVVLDRYWWSTWVYGIVAGADAASLKAMIEVEQVHWGTVKPLMAFLISRRKARPDDDLRARQLRIEEYRKLVANERNDYPIRLIDNESTIPVALQLLLKNLTEVGWVLQKSPETKGRTRQMSLLLEKTAITAPPAVFTRLSPAKTTAVYDSYWRFAHERQQVFFARLGNQPWPWTDDPVLREFKFTNAYRASDRVSQYLIRNVIHPSDKSANEIFFRILLFKLFNRIDTWELLQRELGEIHYAAYSFKRYEGILNAAMARGERVYSAAYIMPSGGAAAGPGRKHSMHLRLLERMIKEHLPDKIASARNMAQAFELIRAYPTIGDFLAYQYVTDLNYSPLTSFSEMEFVVPGPGAFSGIHKCFSDLGGLTESEIIKVVTERQEQEFERLGLPFKNLWGRRLQLIDCQNLFCETDKYARVMHPEFNGASGRTRIKQRFEANREPIKPMYPPKWGINKLIK